MPNNAVPDPLEKVGRWMSLREYGLMVSTGMVQESFSGTTRVVFPADADAFGAQAKIGDVYVEFDVPLSCLQQTKEGWAKIKGPNTTEGRLATRKGLAILQMPRASNVVRILTKR